MKIAVFSGTQEDPFVTFEGSFENVGAAAPTVRRIEDRGAFCATVPIGFDHATYLTADPEQDRL